jgi:hypothetical protein
LAKRTRLPDEKHYRYGDARGFDEFSHGPRS